MVKRKRQSPSTKSNTSKAPTVREVREFLGKYEEEQPFFIPTVQDDSATSNSDNNPDIEFYRRMYKALHPQFKSSCSTSESNSKIIQGITGDKLDGNSSIITSWRNNPHSFWEAQAQILPEYRLLNRKERLAGFISRAVLLESENKKQQIYKRFTAVSAYGFFRKVVPTSEHTVPEAAVLKFLRSIRLSDSSIETNLKTCATIIQRGHRWVSFCENLSPLKDGRAEYGLLLEPELPDSLFDDKKQLTGKPRKTAIEHLKKSWRPSCLRMVHETARILIEYNENVCWINDNKEQDQDPSGSFAGTFHTTPDQETPEPCQQADTGSLHGETDALAAAFKVSIPTTQQGLNSNGSHTSNVTRTSRLVVGGQRDGTTDDAYDTSAHVCLHNIDKNGTNNSSSVVGDDSHLTRSPGKHVEGFEETENQLGRSQSFSDFLNDKHFDFDLNDGSKLDLDKTLSDWDWWSQLPRD